MTAPRLTFRHIEPGLVRLFHGDLRVGYILAVWSPRPGHTAWEAHLLAVPGDADSRCGEVRRDRLRDVRAELEARLAERGPWWSE